jgi:hypothetical protein
VSCAGYAEPHFDIRYFSIEFASRLFAIAKFTPRFYTVWATTGLSPLLRSSHPRGSFTPEADGQLTPAIAIVDVLRRQRQQ